MSTSSRTTTDNKSSQPPATNRRREFRDQAVQVKDDVRELATTAGRVAAQPAEEYVRSNPLKAMLLAGGAGFVAGLILRGR